MPPFELIIAEICTDGISSGGSVLDTVALSEP